MPDITITQNIDVWCGTCGKGLCSVSSVDSNRGAITLNKRIVIVENEKFGEGKSYPRMLQEWENEANGIEEITVMGGSPIYVE